MEITISYSSPQRNTGDGLSQTAKDMSLSSEVVQYDKSFPALLFIQFFDGSAYLLSKMEITLVVRVLS